MTTKLVTAANRLAVLEGDLDRRWSKKRPLGALYREYKVHPRRPVGSRERPGANYELLARQVFGPNDSATNIIKCQTDQLRRATTQPNITHRSSAPSRNIPSQASRRSVKSSRAVKTADQSAYLDRDIRESRQKELASSRDIKRFLNRDPPRLIRIARGQNVDGLGFCKDVNYVSVSGVEGQVENSVEAFAQESDQLLAISSTSARRVAEEMRDGGRINIGRNGELLKPRKSNLQSAGSGSFVAEFLSDAGDFVDPREIPLSWEGQLAKEDVTVRTSSAPKQEKARPNLCERYPVRFEKLIEERPELLTRSSTGGYEFVRREQQRPPSTKGSRIVSNGRYVYVSLEKIGGMLLDDIPVSNAAPLEADASKSAISAEESTIVGNFQPPPGSPMSVSVQKSQRRVPAAVAEMQKKKILSYRPRTPSSIVEWSPDKGSGQPPFASDPRMPRTAPVGSSRRNSTPRSRPESRSHNDKRGSVNDLSYVSLSHPLYNSVKPRTPNPNDTQIINIIVDTNEEAHDNHILIGAQTQTSRGHTAGSQEKAMTSSVHSIQSAGLGHLSGSNASLGYTNAIQQDAPRMDEPRSGTASSASHKRPSSTASANSQQPPYSAGIYVQIASKPANNPPPAPTPEPPRAEPSPPPKTNKKVRINAPK